MDLDAIAQMEFSPRMSDRDALLWHVEKDPLLRSTITSIYLLDSVPDRARLTRRIDRASRLVPRLRQRVVGNPYSLSPPRWEVDPNFDLHYHLRFVRAPGAGGRRELFEIAEPIAMQGFDRARPLWEFTVVDGLADGGAALIAKVHHSITDGVGGVKLQMEMLDLERDPADRPEDEPMVEAPPAHPLSPPQRLVDAVGFETRRGLDGARGLAGNAGHRLARAGRDPVGVGTDALRTASSVARLLRPAITPHSPLMVDRSLSVRFDTVAVPTAGLKAAGRVVGGHLNDAFVAGVVGALRRYHQWHGFEDVAVLRMGMAISVRDPSSANRVGNRFVPMRLDVPVGIDDDIQRMNAIRERVARERAEPGLALTDAVANVLNRLPASASTALFGSMLRGVDFTTSNVPGPPVPVFLAGSAVQAQLGFGPMAGAALNVTLLSYGDQASLGINMDPAAVTDADRFVEAVRDSFDAILKLA